MKTGTLRNIISCSAVAVLLAQGPCFGARTAAGSGDPAAKTGTGKNTGPKRTRCVDLVKDLNRRLPALERQQKACDTDKPADDCQQVRLKLNRTKQLLNSTIRACSSALSPESSVLSGIDKSDKTFGIDLRNIKSGAVSGLSMDKPPSKERLVAGSRLPAALPATTQGETTAGDSPPVKSGWDGFVSRMSEAGRSLRTLGTKVAGNAIGLVKNVSAGLGNKEPPSTQAPPAAAAPGLQAEPVGGDSGASDGNESEVWVEGTLRDKSTQRALQGIPVIIWNRTRGFLVAKVATDKNGYFNYPGLLTSQEYNFGFNKRDQPDRNEAYETVEINNVRPAGLAHKRELQGKSFVVNADLAPARCSAARNFSLGLDMNAPVDASTGKFSINANANILRGTGAELVRVNFILGPWKSVLDLGRHSSLTWIETYAEVVGRVLSSGAQVYALVGAEAVSAGLPAASRSPGPSDAMEAWLEEYARTFELIVRMFHKDVKIYETFNEPNDWAGGTTAHLHPYWYARMLTRLYAIKQDKDLDDITIVAGPLLAHANETLLGNFQTNPVETAEEYLAEAVRLGSESMEWRKGAPFDGLGYHLYYFGEDSEVKSGHVRKFYGVFLDRIRKLLEGAGAGNRKFWISEFGWRVTRRGEEGETAQAANLAASVNAFALRGDVAGAIWFSLRDFNDPDKRYGLYREDGLSPGSQRKSLEAFRRAACR